MKLGFRYFMEIMVGDHTCASGEVQGADVSIDRYGTTRISQWDVKDGIFPRSTSLWGACE